MNKNIIGLLGALFIAILLVGCGAKDESPKEGTAAEGGKEKAEKGKSDLGDFNVYFDGEVVEEDDKFIIEGKSNLLPGSRLVGEVLVDDGEEVFADTTELVEEDGTFHMELDHHQYGEAEIVVRFDFEGVQDDEIKRHYGEKGQKLKGPFIYKHKASGDILKKAEVKVFYEPNGDNSLVFKAPEWNELPEDYGDPRVWIEIDELTEDGEFFYMHGSSNLLEGSEIRVAYRYNKDKTYVKPDGTFDFKIDYEYLEDEDFVIEFKPSDYQWNEIEEAYGKKGQKLVGNLVKSSQFSSDVQYVEKRIPWDSKKEKANAADTKDKSDNKADEADEEKDTKGNVDEESKADDGEIKDDGETEDEEK